MSAIVGYLAVRFFIRYLQKHTLDVFGWYRLALAAAVGGLALCSLMTAWLRRRFIAGFFITVPLFISVAALVWIFTLVDNATTPLYDRLLGRRIPGLGTVSTAARHSAGRCLSRPT